MATTKKVKSGFSAPAYGKAVPDGYVKKTRADGTITFVPKKAKKK